jgi:hypothetical protein
MAPPLLSYNHLLGAIYQPLVIDRGKYANKVNADSSAFQQPIQLHFLGVRVGEMRKQGWRGLNKS